MIIVVDDEDRENEGDFVAAAEKVTPEMINFMATHGRGLICAPLTEERCKELHLNMMVLHLNMMVDNNTVLHNTQFTVSVDLIGSGCTTGISAHDRAKTIKSLVDENTKPHNLGRPGHIFPLRAKEGGVLRRTGHTEASVDLARLAGLKPAGILVEILNENGTMARLPELIKIAKKFNFKIISIEDLVAYRMEHDSLIEKKEDFNIKTIFGDFRLRAYKQTTNNQIHIALTKGNWQKNEPILTRINTSLINDNILDLLIGNKNNNLNKIFDLIKNEEKGIVLFINQENKASNLLHNLKNLKENKPNTTSKTDNKDFGIGAQILHDLKVDKLRLISNSKHQKRVGMVGYGLEIVDYVEY